MSSLRKSNVARLDRRIFDVLVVGGGINGAVAAACTSARGLRVALVDRGDFAGFTSQQSSNLAWGGIKYMETLELGLVAKLCASRNRLIRAYPSTVKEIRFFTTHTRGFRHGLWKLVLGTWVYWLLGRFFTRPPRRLSLSAMAREEPIVDLDLVDGGFEYSDAYLHDNDARFVWNFVRSALDHGCVAANYVEALGSARAGDLWETRVRDRRTGEVKLVRSRVLVNACGPFVDEVNAASGVTTPHRHVFSKGIHLGDARTGGRKARRCAGCAEPRPHRERKLRATGRRRDVLADHGLTHGGSGQQGGGRQPGAALALRICPQLTLRSNGGKVALTGPTSTVWQTQKLTRAVPMPSSSRPQDRTSAGASGGAASAVSGGARS